MARILSKQWESLEPSLESNPTEAPQERKSSFLREGIFFMAKRRGNPIGASPNRSGRWFQLSRNLNRLCTSTSSPGPVFAVHPAARVGAPEQEFQVHPEPLLEAWGFEIESTL